MTAPHTIKLFIKQEGALGLFLHYNYSLPTNRPWDTFGYPMYEDHLGYKYRFQAIMECLHERIYTKGVVGIIK